MGIFKEKLSETKPEDLRESSGENQGEQIQEQTSEQTKAERKAELKARKGQLKEEIKRYKDEGSDRKEAKEKAMERLKEKEKDPEKMERVEMWEEKIKEKNSSAIETATKNFAYAIKPIFEGKSDREMEKGISFKVGDRKFMINTAGEFPEDIFDAMLWEDSDEEGESKIHTEARIDDSENTKDNNYPRISIKARQAGNPDFYKS